MSGTRQGATTDAAGGIVEAFLRPCGSFDVFDAAETCARNGFMLRRLVPAPRPRGSDGALEILEPNERCARLGFMLAWLGAAPPATEIERPRRRRCGYRS